MPRSSRPWGQAFGPRARAASSPASSGRGSSALPDYALTVQGSYVGSLNEIAELLELVNRKGAPDVPVATRPLDQVNAALNDLRDGKIIGRVVVTP